MEHSDVLIIGSGLAALQLSKNLRNDMNVIILTKSNVRESNSYLAQGGVAAAMGEKDSSYQHYIDTLEAGRFHNDHGLVLEMVEEAPSLINDLHHTGCPFDKKDKGEFMLGREGAHSENRIVHCGGDATGKTMIDFFYKELNRNVSIIENITIYELIIQNNRCVGVKGKFINGATKAYYAHHVVLATGGCGQLYSYTSNAKTVTGDGIALAYKAGAEICDMEFIQFHPTLLKVDGKGTGLISEAVRGEGGRLVTKDGKRIMEGVHPLLDLAPRHLVSKRIYECTNKGIDIFLDISSIEDFEKKFPTVTELCRKNKIDPSMGFIPVVPGCHFLMGGIKTDGYGRSSIDGLYAIGEVACTGVHGANRLASNSLLEALFLGKKLAEWMNEAKCKQVVFSLEKDDKISPHGLRLPAIHKLKTNMMNAVGIVRNGQSLSKQKRWLEKFHVSKWLEADFEDLPAEEITTAFMLITAWLITDSALRRTESRGGHFREDYPVENDRTWRGKQVIQKASIGQPAGNIGS